MTAGKIIGITSIGSGVGQSVVTSCRLSQLPLRTVGLGTNPLAYGAYDCDARDVLPSIYSPEYLEALLEMVARHRIDLLVPCLDDELPILAAAHDRFQALNCGVVVAKPELLKICRDKELMSEVMNRRTGGFVRSFSFENLPAALARGEASYPLIAKPRDGFASRGIAFIHGPEDLSKISANHVVQEIAVPRCGDPFREEFLRKLRRDQLAQVAELSVQLVTGPDGQLIGRFASYNRLNNGVPIEIIPFDSPLLWAEVDRQLSVYQELGLRGPINIQGRLTDDGFRFFELNARFTGITGLRSLMGFAEVEACIKAWLELGVGPPTLCRNVRKVGIRQTADRTIDVNEDPRIGGMIDHLLASPAAPRTRRILVTGATGHLGMCLVRSLATCDRFEVVAAGRSVDKLRGAFADLPQVEICESSIGNVLGYEPARLDCVIHCAFTRGHETAAAIAESLAYTQALFRVLESKQVARLINISSRIVYDPASPIQTEDAPVGPTTAYGIAKYAGELMAAAFLKSNRAARATNVRLSAISGGAPGGNMNDVITKIVKRGFAERRIDVQGGGQSVDVLNVADATRAIQLLVEADEAPLTLNLAGPAVNIEALACSIKTEMERLSPERGVITLQVDGTAKGVTPHQMETSALNRLTGWKAEIPLHQTIRETVAALLPRA